MNRSGPGLERDKGAPGPPRCVKPSFFTSNCNAFLAARSGFVTSIPVSLWRCSFLPCPRAPAGCAVFCMRYPKPYRSATNAFRISFWLGISEITLLTSRKFARGERWLDYTKELDIYTASRT